MSKAKGIDVSTFQGKIDWDQVKGSGKVEFAMLRMGYGNLLAVTDNSSQHTDDMTVGDAVFFAIAVISADHIVILTDFQHPMKHILSAVTLIQRNIVLFQPAVGLFDDENIPVLPYQRAHTVTDIRVDEPAVTLNHIFKSCHCIPSNATCAAEISLLQPSR